MSSNSTKDGKKNTLAENASECLMLILQLRSTNEYGDPANLRNRIGEMFDKFERDTRGAGIDNAKISQAKFALVAFLDETVISSAWSQKDSWLSEPLQLKLFETFNAGEEFFNNLKELRQRTSSNRDVLEVYYLCLTLGFKGKYQLQSPENLRRIIDDLNMELHPEMFKAVEAISPNGRPHDTFAYSVKGKIPAWLYPAGAVVIGIVFYVIMSASISGKASHIIEIIQRMLA